MKNTFYYLCFAFSLILVSVSCDESVSPAELEETAEVVDDNISTQVMVFRVFENVNNYGVAKKTKKTKKNASISEDPIATWNDNTMTLDFTHLNGASGAIVAAFFDEPNYTEGLTTDITFIDYYDGSTIISGSITMLIQEVRESSISFVLSTTDLIITNDEGSYSWVFTQSINWINGVSTLAENNDDYFIVNGTVSQAKEKLVNSITLNDLLISNDCDFVRTGMLEISLDGNSKVTTCDFGVDANGNISEGCNGFMKLTLENLSLLYELNN